MSFYVLRDKKVVEVGPEEWGKAFTVDDRCVARDEANGVNVSTVFRGIDHSFGDGPPLLFETMVFGGNLDGEMERYSTYEDAEAGHESMKKRVEEAG